LKLLPRKYNYIIIETRKEVGMYKREMQERIIRAAKLIEELTRRLESR